MELLTSLSELKKDKIVELIQKLGSIDRIFHCEAQFQFELAWEIQKLFEATSCIQVYLERVKYVESSGDNKYKKRYTDIVVQDQDNNYIAIELKYKTKTGKGICSSLKTHAAQDLGRYDFLWDASRNEQLIKQTDQTFGNCISGFSIILTNDSCYWEKDGKDCIYQDFSLKDKHEIPFEQELKWVYHKSEEQLIASVGNERAKRNIRLSGKYICDWLPYSNNRDLNFYFLVFEFLKKL